MVEKEDLLRFPVKLTIELLKHAATIGMGENATKVVVDSAMELFEQDVLEEFNQWLDKPQTIKRMNQAIEKAESCFRETTKIEVLREGVSKLHGLSSVDHPILLNSLEKWQKEPATTAWNEVIYQIFKQDYGGRITEQSLRTASREYEACLRKHLAMLMDDKWTPKITADAILHNEELLEKLEIKIKNIQNILTTSGIRSSIFDAFKTHYLGSEDGRQTARVFGGREKEIELLNHWLLYESQEFPYAIMTGRAGKGKSALLLHWLEQPDKDETFSNWEVAYYPISSRYGTNREVEIFAALAERLGEIYQVDVNVAQKGIDDRSTIYTLLRQQSVPSKKKLLVVIDGLDEADSPETVRMLFPFAAPENVRILVAARSIEEDDQGIDANKISLKTWAQQLNWQNNWGLYHINLQGLSDEGISNVLEQMGNPLDKLGSQPDVIKELYRLSEDGEPLIVELYIDLLRDKLTREKTITVLDLKYLAPGFDAYIELWIEDQKQLWRGKNRFIEHHVKSLRDYCAFSKGRLSMQDLLWLGDDAFRNNPEMVEDAHSVLARFITQVHSENTTRYFFSHPKLNDFFRGKYQRQGKSNIFHERFVSYGEYVLEKLKSGELTPQMVANQRDYILQFFSDHLGEAQALAPRYYPITSEGWLRSWEALDGIEKGFMRDVDKVWSQAKKEKENGLHIQILAGLCHASVKNLSTNIGKELLLTLYNRGHLKDFQVINFIEQIPNHQIRLDTYLHCLPITQSMSENERNNYYLVIQNLSQQINSEYKHAQVLLTLAISDKKNPQNGLLLTQELVVARQIGDDYQRADALVKLAPAYEEEKQKELYIESWNTAQGILIEPSFDATLSAELGSHLPSELHEEALIVARRMNNILGRAFLIHTLAKAKEGKEREMIFRQALDAFWQVADDEMQFETFFPAIAKDLPENLFEETLHKAQNFRNDYLCGVVLQNLAIRLPIELHEEALEMAWHIKSEYGRPHVFIAMAGIKQGKLREELLDEALQAIRLVDYKFNSINMYLKLAEVCQSEMREKALLEAVAVARSLDDEDSRAHALKMLALAHEGEMREILLLEGFSAAKQIFDEQQLGWQLAELAKYLPANYLGNVLDITRQIKNGEIRANVLSVLAERLPENMLNDVLNVARQINSEVTSALVVQALAKIHQGDVQEMLNSEALKIARAIIDEYSRAWLLNELANNYVGEKQSELLDEAVDVARGISNTTIRTRMLKALATKYDDETRGSLIEQALHAAGQINKESQRAYELKIIMPLLPERLLEEALKAVRQIKSDNDRTETLLALAIVYVYDEEMRMNLLREVLDSAEQFKIEHHRVRILQDSAGYLPEALQGKALDMARRIERDVDRADTLRLLAVKHMGKAREILLREALDNARKINDEFSERVPVLQALAIDYGGEMKQQLLVEALNIVRQLTNDYVRADKLISLVKVLPETLLEDALDIVQQIDVEKGRAGVLMALAMTYEGEMQENLLRETLVTVPKIRPEYSNRGNILKALAELKGLLPKQLLEEVFNSVWLINDEKDRASVLATLAPYLPAEMLEELFEAIGTFSDLDQTTPILHHLFNRYGEFLNAMKIDEIELITQVLDLYKRSTRSTYFVVVGYILQCMQKKDQSLAIDVTKAMDLVSEWWP